MQNTLIAINHNFHNRARKYFTPNRADGSVVDIKSKLQIRFGRRLNLFCCIHGLQMLVSTRLNWNQDKVR